jgi:uncharacterized SAM-binding protein YcdF (DUF218 family)
MMATIGIAALFILSLPIVSGLLISSLENRLSVSQTALQPGAIVILGGDADRTSDPLVRTEAGSLSVQRLAGAALVARRTGLPVLITGGTLGRDEQPVADLMADLFVDAFGLPVTWRETRAMNTCENAEFSAKILRDAGIKSALVVTHAWHMPRALLSFQRVGYPVIASPLYGDRHEVQGLSDFLPHAHAWMRSFYAIHEWIGLAAYGMGVCAQSTPSVISPDGP